MEDSSIRITDHNMLYELNNQLEYASDRLSKLSCSVDSFFRGTLEELEKQLRLLEEALDKAKEELEKAERAADSCHRIQEGEPGWSCDNEERRLSRAIDEFNRCESNLREGTKLLVDIRTYIKAYNSPFNFLTWSGGGKELIDHLAGEHSDKALETLRKIISLAERYIDVSIARGSGSGYALQQNSTSLYATDDHRSVERIREDVEKEQRKFDDYYNVCDANRVIVCPDCHRPIPVCICGNKKGDMKIYEKDE